MAQSLASVPREITAFGEKLIQLRERARLSQPQLAERAGVSAGYIGGIESGLRGKRPSRDVILSLARGLDVQPLELLQAAGRDTPADHGAPTQRPSFQQFVKGEPMLRSDEKAMLVQLYESYVTRRRQR